jgi:uroporphyrinogen-III synthase
MENKIFISCGIKDGTYSSYDFFWPVLECIPLEFLFSMSSASKFSIIFTSKSAVNLFFEKYSFLFPLPKKRFFFSPNKTKQLEKICAVGDGTKKLIQEKYLPRDYEVLVPKQEGLAGCLTEFSFSNDSTVMIYTALNGKSEEIVRELSTMDLPYSIRLCPIYKLHPFYSDFLESFFKRNNAFNKANIVFHASSGLVLREVFHQLCLYFNRESAYDLPSNILFSIEKASTENAARELNLLDRLVT